MGFAATRREKIECPIGSSNETVEAGSDKNGCFHFGAFKVLSGMQLSDAGLPCVYYRGGASGTCLCTRYIRANAASVIVITT